VILTGWNAGLTKIQRSEHPNNNYAVLKTSSLSGENAFFYLFIAAIIFFTGATALPSCKNDVQTVLSLDVVDTLPELTARDIEIYYSEKAKVQIKLVSPYLVNKTGEEEILFFPEGFTVFFYDSAMTLQTTITADYGISYEKKKLMEARHNVVVENKQKEERLNTEELFWDRSKALIYSNQFVKLTTGENVVTGDGLTSREPFDEMVILRPKGLIELKDEPQK
jgi:LPS export ABC transporter protein LptC